MRVLTAWLAVVAAVWAEPSQEYVREAEMAIVESEAVVEGEVLAEPGELEEYLGDLPARMKGPAPADGRLAFRSRLRITTILAGEGVKAEDEIDVLVTIPRMERCVGPAPTAKEYEDYNKGWRGLFRKETAWVFALERGHRHEGVPWRVRRAHGTDGGSRADVEGKLARRKDLQEIAALLIAVPGLEPYWHADTDASRKPLVLLRRDWTPKSLRLTKFGEKVEVLEAEVIGKRPYLEVKELAIDGDAAVARLAYAVEGVAAEVRLAREKGVWAVKTAEVGEK